MKKHIPNTITCCNLLSGCIATYFAFQGQYDLALLMIVVGAVFDFFDGMSARLLGVSSPIGKELDSLADDITFGVAPASIVFQWLSISQFRIGYSHFPVIESQSAILSFQYLPFFAFLIAAFSALRLAKFNLDERQTTSFIGLPTPANALFWGSLIVWLHNREVFGMSNALAELSSCVYIVLALIPLSCYLLVAELPLFALKFKHWGWKGNEVKYIFLLSSALMIVVMGILGLAAVIAWYVLLSILTSRFSKSN